MDNPKNKIEISFYKSDSEALKVAIGEGREEVQIVYPGQENLPVISI